jgi:hypothetical protein
MIKSIARIRAELNVDLFCDSEVFGHSDIKVGETGPSEGVARPPSSPSGVTERRSGCLRISEQLHASVGIDVDLGGNCGPVPIKNRRGVVGKAHGE